MKTKKTIRFIPAFVTAFVLCTTVAFAQKPYTLDDLDQFIKVERLSERVLVIRMGLTNFETVTAIATQKGIVVIDAGMSPPVTEKYRRIIEKEFNRTDFVYVINTHSDQDHTFGNRTFPEAKIIGQENGKTELIKNWKEKYYENVFNNLLNQRLEELKTVDKNSDRAKQIHISTFKISLLLSDIKNNFTLPLPQILFNDEMTLNMGDVTFQLVYFGKAHRESDILIFVPEEKLLFVGDLFDETSVVDFKKLGKENAEKWFSALRNLITTENEIKYVINGHCKFTMSYKELLKFSDNISSFWNGYKEGKELYNYEALIMIIEGSGLNGLLSEFKKLREGEKNKYFFIEGNFNAIANGLISYNLIKEAIEIFRITVELFPESWNAYESLGEAYMKAGNKELAIENYEKSLELNPQNTNAVEQLKKLRVK